MSKSIKMKTIETVDMHFYWLKPYSTSSKLKGMLSHDFSMLPFVVHAVPVTILSYIEISFKIIAFGLLSLSFPENA